MNQQTNHPTIAFLTAHIVLPIKDGIRIGDWVDEIALKEIFRLSDSSIDNYRKQGKLPCTKFGGRLFFNLAYIIQIFEQNCC